jgi:hypothetical protein
MVVSRGVIPAFRARSCSICRWVVSQVRLPTAAALDWRDLNFNAKLVKVAFASTVMVG